MNKINVLSLFDGMGCARIALDQLNIDCNYYASEIERYPDGKIAGLYAMKVAKHNYPDINHIGDVTQVKAEDLPNDIFLLVGGSPCTDMSISKANREGLEGKHSSLFWEYVRILKEVKPKYFLLENVKSMPDKDKIIISKALGVQPIMINSALMTAQNRERYYWTNIPGLSQPLDRGILLKDIIEEGYVDRDKAYCLTSTYRMDGLKHYLNRKQRQVVFKTGIYTVPRGYNKGGIRVTDKAPALTSNSWEHNNKLVINTKGCAKRTRDGSKKLEIRKDGKANALTTVSSDSMVFIEADKSNRSSNLDYLGGIISGRNKWLNDGKNLSRNFSQGNRVYSTEGKSVTLNANGGGMGAKTGLYYTKEQIRTLTVLECERLQSVIEGYCSIVSKSQAYKMLGNGFTVLVIMWILSHLLLNETCIKFKKENSQNLLF